MSKQTKTAIKKIIVLFLGWRSLLFLVAFLANRVLEYKPSFPYSLKLASTGLPSWVYSWANFDGVHYLTIVDKGYKGTGLIQAFFPVYPVLTRWLNKLIKLSGLAEFTGWTGSTIISGLLISNLFFVLALILGYLLIERYHDRKIAFVSVLIMLFWPTSFFFGALYTESLFLSLVFASFLIIGLEKNTISAVLGGLSSGVRLIGAALFPALSLELWLQGKKKLFSYLPLILSLAGLVGFMIYLQQTFNDPFYFFNVQSEFGAGRQESIILLPQVFYRSFKILLTARPFNWKYFSYVQDLVFSLIGLFGLVIGWFRIRRSWILFGAISFLLPTLTGTLSSMPRYLLVVFPVFVWLATLLQKKKKYLICYLIISLILLIINTALFIQGYWVA
ncbi:MAG: hypothetical protein GF381_00870 [Candidatus Pacebacteria bacterium]|nr:hypothetical protein [Candidatus Paceibacterota bacterium]